MYMRGFGKQYETHSRKVLDDPERSAPRWRVVAELEPRPADAADSVYVGSLGTPPKRGRFLKHRLTATPQACAP
jgi:hypothetical protein